MMLLRRLKDNLKRVEVMLGLGIAKLFCGLYMLRLPELAYPDHGFQWPLVVAGVLLVFAGLHYVDGGIKMGRDVSLLLFVSKVSNMRLMNPNYQWALISVSILFVAIGVFKWITATDAATILVSAGVVSIVMPVVNLAVRIADRLPLYNGSPNSSNHHLEHEH